LRYALPHFGLNNCIVLIYIEVMHCQKKLKTNLVFLGLNFFYRTDASIGHIFDKLRCDITCSRGRWQGRMGWWKPRPSMQSSDVNFQQQILPVVEDGDKGEWDDESHDRRCNHLMSIFNNKFLHGPGLGNF